MSKKKSASQLAAELEYFKKNNIPFEVKKEKPNKVIKTDKIEYKKSGLQPYGLGNTKNFSIYISTINNIMPQVQFANDKDVVKKLLEDYRVFLQEIVKLPFVHQINEYLFPNFADLGICFYARKKYGWRITECDWINDFVNIDGYWNITPKECISSKEIVDCIQFRVNKLEEILNSFQ